MKTRHIIAIGLLTATATALLFFGIKKTNFKPKTLQTNAGTTPQEVTPTEEETNEQDRNAITTYENYTDITNTFIYEINPNEISGNNVWILRTLYNTFNFNAQTIYQFKLTFNTNINLQQISRVFINNDVFNNSTRIDQRTDQNFILNERTYTYTAYFRSTYTMAQYFGLIRIDTTSNIGTITNKVTYNLYKTEEYLKNTIWLFNDTITQPENNIDLHINFWSNNLNFEYFTLSTVNNTKYFFYTTYNTGTIYEPARLDNNTWVLKPEFKVINFKQGNITYNLNNENLINFLQNNATYIDNFTNYYNLGYQDGQQVGYTTGYIAGQTDGYAEGYNDSDAFNHPIDFAPMMLNILTMPFTFISQAFDVTLWPGTQYQINIGNFIKAMIAISAILFIIRLFTSGFSIIGNYTTNINKEAKMRSDNRKSKQAWKSQKIAEKGAKKANKE